MDNDGVKLRRRGALLWTALVPLVGGPAAAQTQADTVWLIRPRVESAWSGIVPASGLRRGQPVRVRSESVLFDGYSEQLTPDALRVRQDAGAVWIRRADVDELWLQRSVASRYTVRGLGIGALSGGLFLGWYGSGLCDAADCSGAFMDGFQTGALLGATAGAVIGYWIGYLRPEWQRVFVRRVEDTPPEMGAYFAAIAPRVGGAPQPIAREGSSSRWGRALWGGPFLGGTTGLATTLITEAEPAAGAIFGGFAGLTGGLLVAYKERSRPLTRGEGFRRGLIPGAILGALGGASSFGPAGAVVWAAIMGLPSGVSGALVASGAAS